MPPRRHKGVRGASATSAAAASKKMVNAASKKNAKPLSVAMSSDEASERQHEEVPIRGVTPLKTPYRLKSHTAQRVSFHSCFMSKQSIKLESVFSVKISYQNLKVLKRISSTGGGGLYFPHLHLHLHLVISHTLLYKETYKGEE